VISIPQKKVPNSADKMPDSEQERQIYKYVLENEIQKLRLRQKKIGPQIKPCIKPFHPAHPSPDRKVWMKRWNVK